MYKLYIYICIKLRKLSFLFMKNKLFIIVGPSGTGKTTLLNELVNSDLNLKKIITYTTRHPREGEVDGVDYHFISTQVFNKMVINNEFAEYSNAYNNMYGTTKESISEEDNQIVVLDSNGVLSLSSIRKNLVIIYLQLDISKAKERILSRGLVDNLNHRLDIYYKEKKKIQNLTINEFNSGSKTELFNNVYNFIKKIKKKVDNSFK